MCLQNLNKYAKARLHLPLIVKWLNLILKELIKYQGFFTAEWIYINCSTAIGSINRILASYYFIQAF